MNVLAQGANVNIGGSTVYIKGPLVGIDSISDLIGVLTNSILIPVAGVIVFVILIWGGYDLLMSQGDSDRVQSGKNKITAAIVGFVLLILSYFITQVIGYIFGVGNGMF